MIRRQKKWFYRLGIGDIKKINALNNLKKKVTSLTLGEGELIAERVGSYPYPYDKTFKEHKEKDIVENVWKKLLKNQLDFVDDVQHSGFFCVQYCFCFFLS